MNKPKPCCKDWEKQIKLVNETIEWGIYNTNSAIIADTRRNRKPFRYCPWCGKKITKVKGKK